MKRNAIAHDGYVALLDALYVGGTKVGNLSEEGLDWSGEDAQKFKIYAAQKRNAPVKEIKTRDATNDLTGKMIQLKPANCVTLMGGSVNVETGGWDAPADSQMIEGPIKILAGTGYTLDIRHAALSMANLRGGFGGEKTLGIQFSISILTPPDGGSPYSIYPTIPFLSVDPAALTFEQAGSSEVIEVEASGPFSVGKVPDGFSIEIEDGRVTVTASENATSSQRTGTLEFILQADTSKKSTVTLTQSA